MALSDSLGQLAKKSLQFKLTLLVCAVAVLGFMYYQFRYSELADEESKLEDSKKSLSAQQRKLDQNLAEQQSLNAEKDELQQTIRDNQKALPGKAELPALFDHLQRKAGDAGVTIRKWERLDEEPVDVYVRVPVRVEVSGSFYQLMHYFHLLGPQSKDTLILDKDGNELHQRIDERIVSIENLEIDKAAFDDGELKLEANFIAATFRQDEPQPTKTAAPAKAKTNQPTAGKPGQPRSGGQPPSTKSSSGGQNDNSGARPGGAI